MSGPLLSPHWFRVSALRPRLRAHVRAQRQKHRGELWYHVADAGSGRHHRLNLAAYRLVGRLDGSHTLDEIWKALVTTHGEEALTQDEAIRVLGQLNATGLLQCELTPDIERLFRQHHARTRRRRWLELNPLAIRVRLFDPSRHLARFDSWLPWLFRPAAFAVWLAAVLFALMLALSNWAELKAFAAVRADTPRLLVIAWLAYPLIKAVHELGHALAVRRWGGDVHDVGLTLFVLVPVPYVDASAASGFTSRSQRAVVSAIGIMVELFTASLALFVWLNVEPGWVRDSAFVVMLIGAVSTVVFNGNPLLRFDGYYLLCDLFDLPNLDARSRTWWGNLLLRRLFRVDVPVLPLSAGERRWLLSYAPLAWAYRIYVGAVIALWVGTKFAVLGLAVAASVLVMLVVMPIARLVRGIVRSGAGTARQRSLRILWATAATLVALMLVPIPYGAVTQAVVWLPEQAQVRAETEGFVREVRVRDGAAIVPGQVLAVLDDAALLAGVAEADARLMALRVRHFHALQHDSVEAGNLARAIAHAEAEVERFAVRVAQLQIRSQAAGRMVMARQDDLPGTFMNKGQVLGYVLAPGELLVRAAVPNAEAERVRARSRSAGVWLEELAGAPVPGRILREIPAATFTLPSAALSDRNGGTVVTDSADNGHLRTLEPMFMVDVAAPANLLQRIGGRAWVRFDFGLEPLAFQWTHALRQLLLRHFGGLIASLAAGQRSSTA